MNKKFSTLVAALLLSGALSVNAASISIADFDKDNQGIELTTAEMTFTEDVTIKESADYLLIDRDNFVVDGRGHKLNGRIVITGHNVTVKNLTINYKNAETNGSLASQAVNKTAITVISGNVTIDNNVINCSSSTYLCNAITVFPTAADAEIVVTNNTINNANKIYPNGDSKTASTGFQIAGDYPLSGTGLASLATSESRTPKDLSKLKITFADNTFDKCSQDIAYSTNWSGEGKTTHTLVTPLYKEGKVLNDFVLVESINAGVASIVFNGTAEDLVKVLGSNEITGSAAVVCDGANVLFGNAENPNNGQGAINKDVETLPEKLFGHELAETETSNYSLLIQASPNNDSYYAVVADEDGKPEMVEVTADNIEELAKNKSALWKMSKGSHLNKTYYTFKNLNDVDLKAVSGTDAKNGLFYPEQALYNNGVVFKLDGVQQNSKWYLGESTSEKSIFGLYKAAYNALPAKDLLVRYDEYFKMTITYDKDGENETDLTGIFEGELTPIVDAEYSSGKFIYSEASTETSFMLINQDEKILVMNTNPDANISSANKNHVCPLELVTPKEYFLDQASDKYYKSNFVFEVAPSKTPGADVETADRVYVGGKQLGCYKDGKEFILVAADEEVTLLPVEIAINSKQNVVDATKWLTKPVYYTVEVVNKDKESDNYGKVLGLDEYGYPSLVNPAKTNIDQPEGQFAIAFEEEYVIDWENDQEVKAPRYVFTNRENMREGYLIEPGRLYKTAEENVFAYGRDTLAIKPVTEFTSEDGFRRLSANELNDSTYTIAMSMLDDSYLYVVENHTDKHRLGLDREAATEWRIELPTFDMMDKVNDKIKVATDTVTIPTPISYYDAAGKAWRTTAKYVDGKYNKKYYVPATELKVVTYILKNTDNGEYLYGKVESNLEEIGNAYYVCEESKENATRIALKEVGENTVNLVPAYAWYNGYRYDWSADREISEDDYVKYYANSLCLAGQKIIGGTTSKTGVLKDVNRFSATTNDLFVIAPTAAPVYKKLDQGDKIIISREENNDEVIYEKGEFAGINNIKAYKDINPALYVDTAYVNREGNYQYQYLLGVDINRVDSTEQCNNPAHVGLHTAYTEGRFLINMQDSLEANEDVHNNKYEYEGESKLAFVSGIHQNDSLYITDAAGKVISKSEVGNADLHYAKFAFRMIDEEANEFVVEVLKEAGKKEYFSGVWSGSYVEEPVKGYLRWHNGNLVVTNTIEKAEHFTMDATELIPTANDEIAASEVSIIATNGSIIVKGAAGKTIAISNILGQTIANAVISSDNETIAVPAGIAVVAVEGEEAVKVVVK